MRLSLDPGLTLVLVLTLFNIVPLAIDPAWPTGSDALHPGYSAAELWGALEQGEPARGWSDGYSRDNGSPLLQIYARLTYELAGRLDPLASFGALEGLRWLLIGFLLAGGGGMALFCRRRSGPLGAAVAGLLYVYSPYLIFTEAYARGAYSELLAYGLFPVLLWRVDALRDRPNRANFLAVGLLQAGLINAHVLLALTLTAIVVAWVAFETAVQRFNREASQMGAGSGLLALLAILLGICGSATFWLPALLESDSEPVEVPAAESRDDRRNLVGLRELLSPPIQDAGAIKGLRELRILGVAQWSLALTGALGGAALYIRGYRTRHPQAFLGSVFFGSFALALIFLMTPAAEGIWAGSLALQGLISARLLGPAAVCLAIVGSLNGFWLERLEAPYQLSMIALVVALPIVTAFPLLYAPEWRHSRLDEPIGAHHQGEGAGRQLDITAVDESRSRDGHTTLARHAASALSAVSIVVLFLALWRLRNKPATVHPYSTSLPLSRASLIGILLGGGIAFMTFALAFGQGLAGH